ncbi:hypothetical protein AB0M94_40180 [Streptomyces xanthochromogenes]|uniref:hypothetical protein n=1 Tax=Streptomyces xanthochromogenes TaxID=67384 RepID=UPI003413DD43
MECSEFVRVPEEEQRKALSYPGVEITDLPVPVTCELDPHPHGEHVAQLLYMVEPAGAALWLAWGRGVGMELRCLPVCESSSPTEQSACWLPVRHRGGHSWERQE